MRKKTILFFVSLFIFIISLPLGSKMMLELVHDQRLASQYQIINVSEGEPPTNSTYLFAGNKVEIQEVMKDEEYYIDPWNNKIGMANISLKVNGSIIEKLMNHPVRLEEEGLNRYFGEVAYLIVKDLKERENQLYVVVKKTRELMKEMPNGDIIGWERDEKLNFILHAIDENGSVEEQSFTFTDRDALQTKLLNAGTLGPHRVGYYTDLWEGYPTFFFPLLYPVGTLMIGFFFSIIFFPYKRLTKRNR